MVKIILGLGNPGKEYESTPHNIGFAFLDFLQKTENGFSSWRQEKKFLGLLAEKIEEGQKIILLKPQTFMNNSGLAAQKIMAYYSLPLDNLLVVHDEIDLASGTFKVQKNKNAAGHRGVLSLIQHLQSKNFWRLRIGVNPQIKNGRSCLSLPTEKFVLKKMPPEEEEKIKKIFPLAWKACKEKSSLF